MSEGRSLREPLLLLAIISIALMRKVFEQNLVSHMLLELPLLSVCGSLLARRFVHVFDRLGQTVDAGGATGVALALLIFAFWMLPRSIDQSLSSPLLELGKFVTLPIAGAALTLSWYRIPRLAIGILKCNLVSMLLVMSWIYTASPSRLCNSYLRGDQDLLGEMVGILGIALGVRVRHLRVHRKYRS